MKYDLKWLKENALFGCVSGDGACAAEVSYHAYMLRETKAGPVCEGCWDGGEREHQESSAAWIDLPEFSPFECATSHKQ